MEIGQAIKKIRKEKKIKQYVLSEKTGLSQSYLSLIEKTHRQPSLDTLELICKVFGCPVSILFWYALEEKDVSDKKKDAFRMLKPLIDQMVLELVGDDLETEIKQKL